VDSIKKIVIYYLTSENETTENTVNLINDLINRLPNEFTVMGVFIELLNSSDELTKLINHDLTIIDYLLINKTLDNDFDVQLLMELGRINNFKVSLFSEIQ